jgi:hypothetical protein
MEKPRLKAAALVVKLVRAYTATHQILVPAASGTAAAQVTNTWRSNQKKVIELFTAGVPA